VGAVNFRRNLFTSRLLGKFRMPRLMLSDGQYARIGFCRGKVEKLYKGTMIRIAYITNE